jgi:hypothetical protein
MATRRLAQAQPAAERGIVGDGIGRSPSFHKSGTQLVA